MAQPNLPRLSDEKFWSYYLLEGKREDDVAFQAWQGDMDKSLLLAGLFSASLSTLLVANLTFASQHIQQWVTVVWSLSLVFSFFAAFGALSLQEWIRQYNRNLSSSPDPVRRAKRRMYLFGGRRSRHLGTIVASVLASLHIAFILFCMGFVGFLYSFSHTASTICIPFLSVGGLLYFFFTIDHSINEWSPFATPPARVIAWFRQISGRLYRRIDPERGEVATSLDTEPNERSPSATPGPARVIAWFRLYLRPEISEALDRQVDPDHGEVVTSLDMEPDGWMIAEGMNWLINQSLSGHDDIYNAETFLDGIPGFIANHWERSDWKDVSRDNKEKLFGTIFDLVSTCTSMPPISIEIRRPRVVVTLRALIYLMVFDQKGQLLNNVPEERSKELKLLARDGDSVIMAWANCALASVMRGVLQKDSNRIELPQRLPHHDVFLKEVDHMLEEMEKERRLVEKGLDEGNNTEASENHNLLIPDIFSAKPAQMLRSEAIESARDLIGSIQEAIMTCRTNCGFFEKFEDDLVDCKSGFRFSDPLLLLLVGQNLLLKTIKFSDSQFSKSRVLSLQGNLRGIHLLPKLPEDLDFRSVLYNDPHHHIHVGIESPPAAREMLPFLQRKSQDQNRNQEEPWRQDTIKQRERNYNNRLKVNPSMHSIPESIRRPYQSSAWLLSDLADKKVAVQMHWIVLSLNWGPASV